MCISPRNSLACIRHLLCAVSLRRTGFLHSIRMWMDSDFSFLFSLLSASFINQPLPRQVGADYCGCSCNPADLIYPLYYSSITRATRSRFGLLNLCFTRGLNG